MSDFTLFPSLNLIYSLNEQSKLRFSMFKTTARPSFKEKSLAAIYDGVSNITFNGNIDLQVSSINNFDLRYESYLNNNQTYSLSFFHKDLFKPIEIASFQALTIFSLLTQIRRASQDLKLRSKKIYIQI